MKEARLDRIGFVVSLAVVALLYGYGARIFGWFPDEHLDRALQQASSVLSEPLYLQPRVYERSGARTLSPAEVQPGLTLISSRWEETSWDPTLRLIDRHGNKLHEWHVDPGWFSDQSRGYSPLGVRRDIADRPVHGVHLYPNGEILFNLEYVGTARLDACGRVQWRNFTGGHHSIAPAQDSTFWIPGATRDVRSSTRAYPEGLPGLDTPMYLDQLDRVSSGGKVLETYDVLDLLYQNGLARHIFKMRMAGEQDVTHLNDVEVLSASHATGFPGFETGDLLLSLRNLDLVMVIDPASREAKWHAFSPFIAQHDPDFLEGGWIGVFDNNRDGTHRGSVLGGSRVVALQPHTDSTRVLFPRSASNSFYTDIMGKWQHLENGNLLLVESRAGRVVEVAPNGGTVWEWVKEPYDESRVPEVTEAIRYDLTAEQVAEWPCSPDENSSNPSAAPTTRP